MEEKLSVSVLIKQNMLGVIQSFLGFGTNFILAVILPIMMGAFLFGQFSLVVGFAYLLSGLYNAGFNNAAIRFISEYATAKKYGQLRAVFLHLFKYNLLMSLVFGVLLAVFSSEVARAYSLEADALAIILAAALIVFYSIVTFLNVVFVGLNKNQYSLMGNSLNSVFLILLPIVLFYTTGQLLWVVLGVLLAYIITSFSLVVPFVTVFKKIFMRESTAIDTKRVNSTVFSLTIISLSILFLYWGILLVLGLFVSPDEIAFFKIALSWFSAVVILIPISMQVLFHSVVSFKTSDDLKRLERYLNTILRYSTIIIIPMTIGAFFFGEGMIRLVYGAEFAMAGTVLKVIIFALFFSFISNIFYGALLAYEKVRRMTEIYLSNFIFGAALSFILIYSFGLLGASLSFLLLNIVMAVMLHKAANFLNWRIKEAAIKPIIASVLMAALIVIAKPYAVSVLESFALMLFSAVFYFAVLYAIKGITKEDLNIVRYLK